MRLEHLATLGTIAALGLSATGASAQQAAVQNFECRFDRQCEEDAPCAKSGYVAAVAVDGAPGRDGPITALLEDDMGQHELSGYRMEGSLAAAAHAPSDGSYLLTIWPGGGARLTSHYPGGPPAVTMVGQCQEAR
ncbi:MAG: hypothetical protein Q4F71_11900 [Paracoccus sp. (in: a-proteobacteria)]|nr:hypothetical protein [Paracoccus sp. (in: a-proteobacteria)]